MEYIIIRAWADHYKRVEDSLQKMVNEFIMKGWKPQGGIAIMQSKDGDYIIYQAMIKGR